MYGLVNKAVQDLIISSAGQEAWEKIKEQAGFTDSGFISMKTYDDSVTFNLVAAASKLLNVPAENLLRSFGEYWILHTSREGYGDMMDAGGSTFPEFLKNLNLLHFRLGNVMQEMRMPRFDVTNEEANSLHLHYRSEREGLAPMVVGLVKGLGKRFNTECLVEQIESKSEGSDHDIFKISW